MNEAHYGPKHRKYPPRIELSRISKTAVPIAMFVGKQDPLATPQNALRAKNEIGRAVVHLQIYDNCDHATFNIGTLPILDDVLAIVK